jgi:hypothetical protein
MTAGIRFMLQGCYDVLAIDEPGYMNLKPEYANALFQLLEERDARKTPNLLRPWPDPCKHASCWSRPGL